MSDAWFTGFADELARCLVDAESCAEACEKLLDEAGVRADPKLRRQVVDAVVGPAAIARVLIDLIDHPPQLALAAARLFRDAAQDGVVRLEKLGGKIDSRDAIVALRRAEESCARLLEVT